MTKGCLQSVTVTFRVLGRVSAEWCGKLLVYNVVLRIRNAKVVGSTPIIGTISNPPQVYRNQLKARMLRFLAGLTSCYQPDSTGIKLPVGGISGGILCLVQ